MALKKVVGLDIGTSGIRAAQVAFTAQGPELERFAQCALPSGAVREGEVNFPDIVTKALSALWSTSKGKKFDTTDVVVGVSNQKTVVRQIELPWAEPGEMRQSLEFQAGDFIPIPVEDASLDFHPIQEYVDESENRMLRMLLVAAQKDMVENLLTAVTTANLTPVRVDLTAFALLRSLMPTAQQAAPIENDPGQAIVDIGAGVTNIIVQHGGVPRFVRILAQGGSTITEAVSLQLGMPADQAESVKMLAAMPMGPANTATPIVQQSVNEFIEEVRGTLDFYMTQSSTGRLREIVLTGGGSLLPGLAQRLSSQLRIPVVTGEPFNSVRITNPQRLGVSQDQLGLLSPFASACIGLALGEAR